MVDELDAIEPEPARPATFLISADNPNVATLPVQGGETWCFRARGTWRDAWIPCGPNGYRNFLADVLDIHPRVKQLPWFYLVGAIKDKPGSCFPIGLGTEHTFAGEPGEPVGDLVVFANDDLGKYGNNHGQIALEMWRGSQSPGGGVEAPTAGLWTDLAELWRDAERTIDRTAGILFVAVLVFLAGFAVTLMPQGRDLIRSVGEDDFQLANPMTWRLLPFAGSLLFLSLQAWFWPRMIVQSNYGSDRRDWNPKWLLEYTPRVLGFAPFAFTILSLCVNQGPNWVFAVILAAICAGLMAYLVKRNAIEQARKDRHGDLTRPLFGRGWAAFGLAMALISMIVAIVWPVAPARFLGAPAVVFLGFGFLIPPAIVLIQLADGIRLPLFGAILLCAVVSSLWLDDHAVGRRVLSASVAPPAAQISLAEAYGDWLKVQGPANSDGSRPIVLIASEGGASRAGFWTGEVLSALHGETNGAIDPRIFAISSVSGGSVGAVGYVAALKENPAATTTQLEARVSGFTGADALAPAASGLLFPDMLQRFALFPFLPDRAQALEQSWEDAWRDGCPSSQPCEKDAMASPFLGLWEDLRSGWKRPLVIVNGAGEESGRPILTSKIQFQGGEIDADNFYALEGHDVAASTAIHNGARFPWVSPAGGLAYAGHIVDGGYFDGAGIETVRQLARAIQAGPGRNDHLRFIIVFIGYAGSANSKDQAVRPPTSPVHTAAFLNDLLAPFTAISQSRTGLGSHLVSVLQNDYSQGQAPKPFVIVKSQDGSLLQGAYVPILLCDGPDFQAPMDWALSIKAQTYMRAAMGFHGSVDCGNKAAIDLIGDLIKRS